MSRFGNFFFFVVLSSLWYSRRSSGRTTPEGIQRRHGAFEGSIVLVEGDPILARNATEVFEEEMVCRHDDIDDDDDTCGSKVEAYVERMMRGMRETYGSCIAAPQVGISKRVILMSLPRERLLEEHNEEDGGNKVSPPAILVNPEIGPLNPSDPTVYVWEGCLSVPGKYLVVPRYTSIWYKAQRMDGVWFRGIARGRLALTMQHEVDHLNGVLMTDVAVPVETIEGALSTIRSDARGAVTSTDHFDLMKTIPGYNLRTYIPEGASLWVDSAASHTKSRRRTKAYTEL